MRTENFRRMSTGSAARRSAIVKTPIALSRFPSLPAIPQIPVTGTRDMMWSTWASGIRSRLHTPPIAGFCLATRLANLARVFVGAIPTQTGSPVCRAIAALMAVPCSCSARGDPASPRNDSSIEYTSCQAANRPISSIARALRSPYSS